MFKNNRIRALEKRIEALEREFQEMKTQLIVSDDPARCSKCGHAMIETTSFGQPDRKYICPKCGATSRLSYEIREEAVELR